MGILRRQYASCLKNTCQGGKGQWARLVKSEERRLWDHAHLSGHHKVSGWTFHREQGTWIEQSLPPHLSPPHHSDLTWKFQVHSGCRCILPAADLLNPHSQETPSSFARHHIPNSTWMPPKHRMYLVHSMITHKWKSHLSEWNCSAD